MLIITFHNDGTGDEIEGNYNWKVHLNHNILDRGKIKGHNRLTGWKGLLRYFVEEVCNKEE